MLLTSILMPVKDEAPFLADCLASIQPPPNFPLEVVLVDDHSTDDTYRIASRIAASREDLTIRVLRNTGRGKAAALNLAFANSRGRAFLLLAGDDLLVSALLPDRVSAVTCPGPAIAQCRYRSFSDNPRHDGTIFPRSGRRDHLAGGATSFNRDFADLYFPIPESLPNEDSWLRAVAILYSLPIRFIDTVGLHYRIHARNSTGPTLDFSRTSQGLSQRHAAFAMALKQMPGGTVQGRARLEALRRAEAHRAAGRWWRILCFNELSQSDRGTFLANATPWLFALKHRILPWLKR